MSQDVIEAVNRQVANWTVLYMKLHNYHWFIKGHHFFVLHGKFEELYNEAGQHIDVLAERVLALGGKPVATLQECLELASVKEASGNEKEEDMVKAVKTDFSTMAEELKEAVKLAEQRDDQGTADMLLAVKQSLDKHIWMLMAFLG